MQSCRVDVLQVEASGWSTTSPCLKSPKGTKINNEPRHRSPEWLETGEFPIKIDVGFRMRRAAKAIQPDQGFRGNLDHDEDPIQVQVGAVRSAAVTGW